MLIHDFNEKFHDLKTMEFSSWLTQPLLVDLSAVSEQRQQELCELQQDEVVKTLFKIKGSTMWLSEECEKKYPPPSTSAREKFISFPSSCMVKCGVSVVTDLLRAERNQLQTTKVGDVQWRMQKISEGGSRLVTVVWRHKVPKARPF